MNLRVLMFGALADAAAKEATIDLAADPTTDDVLRAIAALYPDAAPILERVSVAVDQEVVPAGTRIAVGAEVALLPPSSGGALHVLLTDEPSTDRALASVGGAGGVVVFVGNVRDSCELGVVERLDYTAYDAMASRVLTTIADEAATKWQLDGVAIEHAVGRRPAGAITFVVVCAAAHRDAAFDACRYVVDEVKRRAPIWKKEIGPWGERWIGL